MDYSQRMGRSPTEHLVKLQASVETALRKGLPIITPGTDAFGDNFLNYRAHYVVLRKFCEKKGIPFDPQHPPLKMTVVGKQNEGFPFWGLQHSHISPLNEVYSEPNRYTRNLRILGKLLDVELTKEELQALPLPLTTNDGPLKNFDEARVQHRAVELAISPERSGKKQIVIVQAGSKDVKRFDDSQVAQLVQETKATYPESYVTVVTDQVFNKQSPADIPSFGADSVVRSPDINEIGAHFAMNNSLIVTTDTFLAWYAAGCQAMLPENNGKLPENTLIDLYTVANPDHWHIPGAHAVESFALEAARKAPGKMSEMDGLIQEETYLDYWLYGEDFRATRFSHINESARNLHGIAPEDINAVIKAIRKTAGDQGRRARSAS